MRIAFLLLAGLLAAATTSPLAADWVPAMMGHDLGDFPDVYPGLVRPAAA